MPDFEAARGAAPVAALDAALDAEMALIAASGLFLPAWYAQRYHFEDDALRHFCQTGRAQGHAPNPYFSPAFYLAQNPDVAASGDDPLLHYITHGEAESRDPCPFFHVGWYRQTYGLAPGEAVLRHFLERRLTGQVNPVPLFDAAYYLDSNPDVAAGGADPFEHFLGFGAAEGRNPSPQFDLRFYANRYNSVLGGQNPLLHYLANAQSGQFFQQRPAHEALVPGGVKWATRASPDFEDVRPAPGHIAPLAKLLAFYLPQFHPVAENDAWWGKGFTDWTNLARAVPRFAGHLQPRAPRDLGYYSLDDPAVLHRQVALAKGAKLSGFVFYYYWFNGKRLLDAPLEQYLADPSIDFPFCVMWANENWTRRWDGLEREVLIAQEYRERDDAGLVASFARLFADPRYIRLAGRPLLMIYRASLIPDAVTRIRRWRQMFRDGFGENPVIIMAQSLGDHDPGLFELDGAVEFPPHGLGQRAVKINDSLDYLDGESTAAVYDYEAFAEVSLRIETPDYPLIKTIVPGWDNDPRREGKGLVLHRASPAKYRAWLEKLVAHTAENRFFGERILCVNAWNEWAEGAFLEPDIHFGGAFLNATAAALCATAATAAGTGILLVGHDAQPHGAQMLLLHIARRLRLQWGLQVHLLLLGVGPLMADYAATAEMNIAYDPTILGRHFDTYKKLGIRAAIVNSAASARVVRPLAARGIAATMLVHEMPDLLREYHLEVQARLGARDAANMVFSSPHVARKFRAAVDVGPENSVILPQGNYQNISYDAGMRQQVRRRLGIADEAYLVLAAGFADLRKGFDLFLQIAAAMAKQRNDVRFVWVGEIHFTLQTYLGAQMRALNNFTHIGFTKDIAGYFSAADIYALTSREDPYPTVVLEALSCGAPCVAFDDTGGIPGLLRDTASGLVAASFDPDDFTAKLIRLLDHERLREGRAAIAEMAAATFDFDDYTEKLLRLALPDLTTVSVCVLNYNYARYLPGRLGAVFAQTYPVREILFFDDASTDDSLSVATALAGQAGREMRVIANVKNSGAVFSQWQRAAEAAKGDYIWIAEADDECAPEFLARLVSAMAATPAPLLAFTDSRAVDEAGAMLMPDYKNYYLESAAPALCESGHWDGATFARAFLAERNLILNVSAVLWRRDALLAALDACAEELGRWRIAGDWRLYLEVLAHHDGSVVYVADPLNTHRRHGKSVTHTLDAQIHAGEIANIHAIAAETLALAPAARAAQARYLAAVRRQLGASGVAESKPAKAGKPAIAPAAKVARPRKT